MNKKVALVKRIMEKSQYGDLSETFVVEILRAGCSAILNHNRKAIAKKIVGVLRESRPAINVNTWYGLATEIVLILEANIPHVIECPACGGHWIQDLHIGYRCNDCDFEERPIEAFQAGSAAFKEVQKAMEEEG